VRAACVRAAGPLDLIAARSTFMRKRILAWTMFIASFLLLSLAATPYSRTADAALIALRLTLVVVLSVLVVRERWRNRHEPLGKASPTGSDIGDSFLQRCRRWYRGE